MASLHNSVIRALQAGARDVRTAFRRLELSEWFELMGDFQGETEYRPGERGVTYHDGRLGAIVLRNPGGLADSVFPVYRAS